MTTLHIDVEESLAEAARQKAASEGKTLEGWVAEVMAQKVGSNANHTVEWARRLLEGANRVQGNSNGWKWNREELYQ
jgi:hypothetical protein